MFFLLDSQWYTLTEQQWERYRRFFSNFKVVEFCNFFFEKITKKTVKKLSILRFKIKTTSLFFLSQSFEVKGAVVNRTYHFFFNNVEALDVY